MSDGKLKDGGGILDVTADSMAFVLANAGIHAIPYGGTAIVDGNFAVLAQMNDDDRTFVTLIFRLGFMVVEATSIEKDHINKIATVLSQNTFPTVPYFTDPQTDHYDTAVFAVGYETTVAWTVTVSEGWLA